MPGSTALGAEGVTASNFPPVDVVVDHYATVSGRAVDNLDFYVALAAFKLAIILEGINARFQMGKTLGEGFDAIGSLVPDIVERALQQANRSSMPALRG